MKQLLKRYAQWIWVSIFSAWFFFLSGVLGDASRSPGILQAAHLRKLLTDKQAQLVRGEALLLDLEAESKRLEQSPWAQELEVRRVLGYIGAKELVFDFNMKR